MGHERTLYSLMERISNEKIILVVCSTILLNFVYTYLEAACPI